MRKCEPRTIRNGNPVIAAAQSRLEARKRAGVATDDALSSMMSEYIETVRGKSGELNVKKKNISPARRGAPIGNRNRVTHGKRTAEMNRLRADVRSHIAVGRELIAQVSKLSSP